MAEFPTDNSDQTEAKIIKFPGPRQTEDNSLPQHPTVIDAEKAGLAPEELRAHLMLGNIKPPEEQEPLGLKGKPNQSRILLDTTGEQRITSLQAIEAGALAAVLARGQRSRRRNK